MSTPPKIPRNDSTRSVLLVTPNENETSSDEDKPKPQENEPEHERVVPLTKDESVQLDSETRCCPWLNNLCCETVVSGI
ncbi:uncharacterized protein LOC109604173 isoform X2 [Aethina tumida]|uniref:uncharacterized protein LOC109604173 isoform X2 n=1 Tax=Aethina tumida TaxID=116153 RepID=UPI00096B577F|nr:uncharacterized protein LOC109604173 isoform X2 [Aethina tumida]